MSTTAGDIDLFSPARAAMRKAREIDFGVLETVAELDARDAATTAGYPSLERLLEDLFRIDRREAKRLVRHASALVAGTALSGEPLPAAAPATAAAAAEGTVSREHVDVVLDAMEHLDRVPGLTPAVLARAEQTLADAARTLPPRGLRKVAARLLATLDPDGAAPPDEPDPDDELHLTSRRDGALAGTFRFHAAADAELVREAMDALSAPAGPDDPRGLDRRRAEAFLDLVAQAVSPTGIATEPTPANPTGHARAADDGHDDGHDDENDNENDDENDNENDDGTGRDDRTTFEAADRAAEAADQRADPRARLDRETGNDGERRPGSAAKGSAIPADAPNRARRPIRPEPPPRNCRATGVPSPRVLGRGSLIVTIDLTRLREQTGHGMLDSDNAITAAEARRIACDAGVVPMVLGTRGEPLDVGRLSYTVPEGMRRALVLRDGGCSFPGCTRRPGRCASHHVVHWADGGPTALHNLTLLCRYHHRLIHHDQWCIQMVGGRPWFIPPRWLDPHRTPRAGGRHPLR